jgi:hypothetical protein
MGNLCRAESRAKAQHQYQSGRDRDAGSGQPGGQHAVHRHPGRASTAVLALRQAHRKQAPDRSKQARQRDENGTAGTISNAPSAALSLAQANATSKAAASTAADMAATIRFLVTLVSKTPQVPARTLSKLNGMPASMPVAIGRASRAMSEAGAPALDRAARCCRRLAAHRWHC